MSKPNRITVVAPETMEASGFSLSTAFGLDFEKMLIINAPINPKNNSISVAIALSI
jgi:hypothetical protein